MLRCETDQLLGCINDARNIEHFLREIGFVKSGIVVLTDDSRDRDRIPTRRNVLKALKWMMADVKKGDACFV